MLTQQLVFNIGGVKARRETLHGRDHLVVPTVAMIAGVLNGSAGPILYEAPDIEASVPVWNHRPLVVYHPKKTAADPVVLNTRGIGITLNAAAKDGKLVMESWIDIEMCKRIDKRVLDRIENSKPVEVSTGLGVDLEPVAGKHGETEYKAIARNYRPDHLAILPDQIGACSVAQGAGLLRNSEGGLVLDQLTRGELMAFGGFAKVLNFSKITNEQSYQELISMLYTAIQARYGYSVCICATYEDTFVYEYDGKMFRLGYSVSDGRVAIADNPEEVYRSVSYVTVSNGADPATVANSQVEDTGMKKSDMVAKLIANGGFEEGDRATLEGFSETKLKGMVDKLTPEAPKGDAAPAAPAVTQNSANTEDPNVVKVSKEEWANVQKLVANAKAIEQQEKDRLIPVILNAKGNLCTEEQLKGMDLRTLRAIAGPIVANQQAEAQAAPSLDRLDHPVLNYEGAAVPGFVVPAVTAHNAANEPVMAPPGSMF